MELNNLPILNDTNGSHINSNSANLNVPTTDEDVRAHLRQRGEPITYFGENNADRRQRLAKLISETPHTNFEHAFVEDDDEDMNSEDEEEDDEDFYTPGTQDLYNHRVKILHYSLNRASIRAEEAKKIAQKQDYIKILKHRRGINSKLINFELYGSQIIQGNTRALSVVRFSPDSKLVACGSWDGSIYILNGKELTTTHVLVPGYHQEKASALDWDRSGSGLLVTGGNEGNINLWKVGEETKMKPHFSWKSAHDQRITKTLFHPSGHYIASTSLDQTWKLWDIELGQSLVQQEGHSQEIFAASFHPDGSLFATGGLDAIGRVWDLRSGRSIATLEKHIKGIYSMDWSPNGYHLATASGDCSVKIWDFRKLDRGSDEIYSIPAHTKLVSDVRFFHRTEPDTMSQPVTDEQGANPELLDSSGTFLATTSYDGLVNVWSADNWIKLKTLKGHSDKIMSCDISGLGSHLVSSGWDRSVKIWNLSK